MTAQIVLRSPTEAEFPKFIAPLSIAFNQELTDAAIENDRRTIELDRFIGALDGDDVVGSAGAYSMRVTVPGGEVGAAGITAVGVLPSHRRRGILRQMMRWLFDQAGERGEPLAILWASEAAIYQRFGYGPGCLTTSFEAQKDKIRFSRPAEPVGQIRIVDLEEAARRFPPIYEIHRQTTAGATSRSEDRWRWEVLSDFEWNRHGNGSKVLAVLEDEGRDRGYVIYRTRGDWDNLGPKGVVTVLEVCAVDGATERALWEWVVDLDLIGTVRGWRGPVPHPLQLLVTEPRRLGVTISDGTWIRILDVERALEARTYQGPFSVVLEVTDDLIPANAGRWRLSSDEAVNGRALVTRAPDVSPDLAVDISDLAAVYLGAFRFADLQRGDRVRECSPGSVAAADVAFATQRAPYTSTMF